MSKPFSFFLVSDPHYFDVSLGAEGEAFEKFNAMEQKCIAETGAVLDAGFERIAADKDTEVILIPGDLVFNGERKSHQGFIEKLNRLKKAGKRIYLITARHDYYAPDFGFEGDIDGVSREELRDLYLDFGFSRAIATYKRDSLSYVAQLAPGIRLLALNCDGDCKDFKGLWDDQMKWALEQIKEAHESGEYIFAMTHYPLLPGSPVMNLIGDAKLTDWEKRATEFADAGLNLIFTGHMHMQSLTEYKTEKGNTVTDICTGSFVGCPAYYRKVTFLENGDIDVKSIPVGEFDHPEKGDKNAEDYFKDKFDSMILGIIDAMAYDFEGFCAKFGNPPALKKLKAPINFVGKKLQKWTLSSLGKMMHIKVDESVKDILLKDIGAELVRNIFSGNEPYVKGTPIYEAMDALLKRLNFILNPLGKKLGEKNPALSDLRGFVLSLIGDEKQLDYDAVLKNAYKKYEEEKI